MIGIIILCIVSSALGAVASSAGLTYVSGQGTFIKNFVTYFLVYIAICVVIIILSLL